MTRLGRILRSRRLAVWLLVAVGAWSVLGTVVPQTSEDPAAVMQLAASSPALDAVLSFLGLYHAYTAWPFLIVIAFLTVSTVVCAWERTGRARSRWREAGLVSQRDAERLRARPEVEIDAAPSTDPGALLERAAAGMSKAGLRVRSGDVVTEGVAGRWGLLGSPVFHWSLALLIIVVGAGALTRSEGLMGVAEGQGVPDAAESYRILGEGPLFPGHTGMIIRVDDMDTEYMDGDVNRGAAPVVTLLDEGTKVASQRVHANRPLRYSWTTIHTSDYGYAPLVSLESSTGVEIDEIPLIVDFIEDDASRTTTAGADLTTGSGVTQYQAFISVLLDGDEPAIEVELLPADETSPGAAPERRVEVLRVGESVELADGSTLGFADLDFYARLSVVHDWSVPLIYALFVVGLLGVSVAVLDPYRRVLAMVVEGDDGTVAHVVVMRGRGALFEDRLREALEEAPDDAD